MYNFTNDWFNYHKYIWDSLINDLNPSKVLEIGSFEGASACYLIDKISKKENSELIYGPGKKLKKGSMRI